MASFEIIGTVSEAPVTLKSQKGNPYAVFNVVDGAQNTFEVSLFGDTMEFLPIVKKGRSVKINGFLGSRSYDDKNGKTRHKPTLKPNSITAYNPEGEIKKASATEKAKAADDFSDLPF